MKKARISEIFQSIQGEGKYAGVKQVFVRFYGCHMHCIWCDTPDSIGDAGGTFEEFSLDEVFVRISQLWPGCHSVSLTGGEPLLQTGFLRQLLPLMKQARMPAYLETSGVLAAELSEVINDIDVIAMDIKMPSSTKCRSYWTEHEEFLTEALKNRETDIFLKVVVSSDTSKEDIVKAVELAARKKPDILFILQPNTFDLSNGVMPKCIDYQNYSLKYLPNTRIVSQMHKFIGVR